MPDGPVVRAVHGEIDDVRPSPLRLFLRLDNAALERQAGAIADINAVVVVAAADVTGLVDDRVLDRDGAGAVVHVVLVARLHTLIPIVDEAPPHREIDGTRIGAAIDEYGATTGLISKTVGVNLGVFERNDLATGKSRLLPV